MDLSEYPGKWNLTAFRYNSFAVEFTLGYDIEDFSYYAQIKNMEGEIVADFTILKGDQFIVLQLDSATATNLVAGTYKYDVVQVGLSDFGIPKIYGDFLLLNGVTERQ